jgi:hypothetical protein
VGHHGAFPCRLFCGVKGRNKPRGSHYYPGLLKPNNYNVVGGNHEDIDVQSIRRPSSDDYQKKLGYLMTSRNPTNYKDKRRDSGISRPSLLMGLRLQHRLGIPAGLCGGTMHATTLNIGDLLLPLWHGAFECEVTDTVDSWPWAVLTGQTWIDHGLAVANARPFIPGCFDRPPRNIALKIKSGYCRRDCSTLIYLRGRCSRTARTEVETCITRYD